MKMDWKSWFGPGGLALACGLCLLAHPLAARAQSDAAAQATNSSSAATVASAEAHEATTTAEKVAVAVSATASNATAAVVEKAAPARRSRHGGENPKVVIGNSAEVREGETVDTLVVIGGNGTVKGKVLEAAVVIGGNLDISGEVGDAAVVVLGNLHLRTNAVVKGDTVSVGDELVTDAGAHVDGERVAVPIGPLKLPEIEKLAQWINECVFKLRPLAPQVGWVWFIAGLVFVFYLLVAVVLNGPVQTCVAELNRRPVTTFFTGILTKLVAPIAILILAVTGIGLLVVPFLIAALFFGAIIGKVALLEYIGEALRRAVGGNEPLKPVFALGAGALLITICYNIPFLGLLVFALLSVWGLGVAVTVGFSSFRREAPAKASPPSSSPSPTNPPGAVAPQPVPATIPVTAAPAAPTAPPPEMSPPETAGAVAFSAPPGANPATPIQPALPAGAVPDALAYPRAGFWERMGASFLDLIIVGILSGLAGDFLRRFLGSQPYPLLVALAYFAGMWAWKGTTVGGVVLNLKVVRLDNGPVSFAVALVRGLGAALSAAVLFLGFLWIAWDEEKQGWHDRIAGTVVVRLPRGKSLIVL